MSCHNCGSNYHKVKDCPRSRSIKRSTCYECNDPSHKKRDCPVIKNRLENQQIEKFRALDLIFLSNIGKTEKRLTMCLKFWHLLRLVQDGVSIP